MSKARRMIPCTDSVMRQGMARVAAVLCDHGLVEISSDVDATADQVMQILEAQGIMADDNIPLGQCLLLPRSGPDFSLLLITPWPAEDHDVATLRRKASPIMFDRTEGDQIIVPARMLLARLEELAKNPAASAELKALALNLARRGVMPDIVLPAEVETIALTVSERDGAVTFIEALPAGIVNVIKLRD